MFDRLNTSFTVQETLVDGIIRQIHEQNNNLESNVYFLLRQIEDSVRSGVWTGEGATAFLEELGNNMIPLVIQMQDRIAGMEWGVRRLLDIVDDAEFQALHAVDTQIQIRKIV